MQNRPINKHWSRKVFKEGVMVMVFFKKESFPLSPTGLKQTKAKMKYDPYEILKKINDNVNMVNLLDDMTIWKTFIMVDWYKYYPLTSHSI